MRFVSSVLLKSKEMAQRRHQCSPEMAAAGNLYMPMFPTDTMEERLEKRQGFSAVLKTISKLMLFLGKLT